MTTSRLPVLIIDGDAFSDFEGFRREFSKLLPDWVWNGNLNAFHDILSGGFGLPEEGFALRWRGSAKSREDLGDDFDYLVEIIRRHGPGGQETETNIHLELA